MISSWLHRIVAAILSRAFWTVVGLILLALLIWFIGPLFALGEWTPLVSESARVWAILALLCFALLRLLIKRWRKGMTNASVLDRLRQTLLPQPKSEQHDLSALRQRFEDALQVLKRARFSTGKGRFGASLLSRGRYLYELPWYIIIGAPGAGKTTALLNSGLSFPLAKSHGKGAVRGVGGTRHCDWWFTNEAVLIDTAGRYTTHESDQLADRAEWQGFLGLLRKTRPSQPINGVLVTLSVTELMDTPADQRARHAEVLRARLNELQNDLGIRLPVYVLVNKCDLLSGFDQYFAGLDRSAREQVWGFTLPLQDVDASRFEPGQAAAELQLLSSRIHEGLVEVLQAEPELGRRALIYSFPQQYDLLCRIVAETIDAIFEASRYSSAPFLRGVYFSSATQEGAPLDRVLTALGGSEGRRAEDGARGTPKSYFLQELLSEVIFPEAHLAGHNARFDRRARLWHLAVYVLCVVLLLGGSLAWTASYRNNLSYIAEVEGKAGKLAEALESQPAVVDGNLFPLLNVMTQAETVVDSVHFRAFDPLKPWTFGLYQGDKLVAGARPIYEALLSERFAPTLKLRLERLLRTVAIEDLEFAYEILKAYLMLHQPEHFDADAFAAFMLADWDYNMPTGTGTQERAALQRHLQALLSLGAQFPAQGPDQALIDATRARLAQFSFEQRTYRRLVRALEHNALPDFSIGAVVGPQAPAVFVRRSGRPLSDGVPSLYSYRGYHELFAGEVANVLRYAGKDDEWVMGVSEASARERAKALSSGSFVLEIKKLYMWDYVDQWERFIEDIDVVTPRSLGEATELVKLLASPDSPLSRLIKAVVTETTLLKDEQAGRRSDYSLLERVRRSARATHDDVSRLVGPSMMPGSLGPEERPELIVDSRFEALRRAAGSGEGGVSLLASPQVLQELHLLLSSVEAARAGGYPPPRSDLPGRLLAEAARLPQPARRLLEAVASTGATLVARETRVAKSTQLVGTVTRSCRETIEGRYPFERSAAQEVAVNDFTRMFGPGGVLDHYFQTELVETVDTSSSPWKLRAGAQGGLGAGGALAQFERAAVIKEVFFRGGAGTPTLNIMIKPIVMDTTITNLSLDLDGQTIRYQHGPQVAYPVRWPGTRGSHQIRLALEPALPNQSAGLVLEGPWALHRLFDKAHIVAGDSPERFRATLDVGGRRVTLEVSAGSVKNPFALQELQTFRCPAGL